MTHILGMTGLKGSGKDTFAQQLIELGEQGKGPKFERIAFGDALKREVADAFGCTIDDLNRRDTKETPQPWLTLDKCSDPAFVALMLKAVPEDFREAAMAAELSPRQVLQTWGTEYRRAMNPDYWLDQVTAVIEAKPGTNFIVTDVRFQAEAALVHQLGGRLIRVDRPGLEAGDSHSSEQDMQSPEFRQYVGQVVTNDGPLELLAGEAAVLAQRLEEPHVIKQQTITVEALRGGLPAGDASRFDRILDSDWAEKAVASVTQFQNDGRFSIPEGATVSFEGSGRQVELRVTEPTGQGSQLVLSEARPHVKIYQYDHMGTPCDRDGRLAEVAYDLNWTDDKGRPNEVNIVSRPAGRLALKVERTERRETHETYDEHGGLRKTARSSWYPDGSQASSYVSERAADGSIVYERETVYHDDGQLAMKRETRPRDMLHEGHPVVSYREQFDAAGRRERQDLTYASPAGLVEVSRQFHPGGAEIEFEEKSPRGRVSITRNAAGTVMRESAELFDESGKPHAVDERPSTSFREWAEAGVLKEEGLSWERHGETVAYQRRTFDAGGLLLRSSELSADGRTEACEYHLNGQLEKHVHDVPCGRGVRTCGRLELDSRGRRVGQELQWNADGQPLRRVLLASREKGEFEARPTAEGLVVNSLLAKTAAAGPRLNPAAETNRTSTNYGWRAEHADGSRTTVDVLLTKGRGGDLSFVVREETRRKDGTLHSIDGPAATHTHYDTYGTELKAERTYAVDGRETDLKMLNRYRTEVLGLPTVSNRAKPSVEKEKSKGASRRTGGLEM